MERYIIDNLTREQAYSKYSNHFIGRIKERYGIDFSLIDYEDLSANPIKYKPKHLFAKSNSTGIESLLIYGREVFVLKNHKFGLYTTCIPNDIETDIHQAIRAAFGKKLNNFSMQVYEIIRKELDSERMDFETDKDAALYYFSNCMFPSLLIKLFKKGSIPNFLICHEINRLISGRHKHTELTIVKR